MALLSDAQFAKLSGITEAKRQMKILPTIVVEEFGEASLATGKAIAYRAASKAPVRKRTLKTRSGGSYSGGMLRKFIAAELQKSTGTTDVGIKRGLAVITMSGLSLVTKARRYRSAHISKGSLHGRWRSSFLKRTERAAIRAAGHKIIQPTMYGHFGEFGKGGRLGMARYSPFMRPSVEGTEDFFLTQMRRAVQAHEPELIAMGFKR